VPSRRGNYDVRNAEKRYNLKRLEQTRHTPQSTSRFLKRKAKSENGLSLSITDFLSEFDPSSWFGKVTIVNLVFSKPIKRDANYYEFKDGIRKCFQKYLDGLNGKRKNQKQQSLVSQ